MEHGQTGGVVLYDNNGQPMRIYWNQHVNTSRTGTFYQHTTTQVRVGSSDSAIVGSFRTYVRSNTSNQPYSTVSHELEYTNQDLLDWAWDAHETYTKTFLLAGNVPLPL